MVGSIMSCCSCIPSRTLPGWSLYAIWNVKGATLNCAGVVSSSKTERDV